MIKDILKNNWIHLLAIAIFMLLALINFHPRLQGKQLPAEDTINVNASQQEINEFKKETGETSLWTNSIFSGMPSYYIAFHKPKDLVDYTMTIMQAGMPREIGFFFIGMLCFYIMMICLGVGPLISILAAICFAFTTNNLILLSAGHTTKVLTLMTSPLVIAGVILSYRHKFLLGLVLFALGMSLNLKSSHPQMTYYLGLVLLPYIILKVIDSIKEKNYLPFLKSSMYLLIGLLIAVGASMSKLWPTYEYSKDTMRGKPILENTQSDYSSSSVEGLSWDYAMNWSNGWEDLLQSFISHSVGGSSGENMSTDSNFAKELRKNRYNTRGGVQGPMYWGSLPGTSGPIYFGIVVFTLFFMGMFQVKGNLKWWILTAVTLTALLSLGKNFEILSRFFYDYFPAYNKFRTPNSILSVTAIIITLFGFYGFSKILDLKSPDLKKLFYPGLGLAVFCLLVAFVGPGISDMSSAYDARYAQMGIDPSILQKDRAELMQSSSIRSAIYVLLTLALLYGYFKQKLKRHHVVLLVGVLAVFDLFSTNFKYVKPSDYQSARLYKSNFQARDVDRQILTDPDPHYRVLDLTIPTFESASSSYYHKTIGGYHAAKLQRYQDMIDYHISKNNMNVLNMLNTKYIIIQGNEGNPVVQRNTAALGNAWYVSEYQLVNSANEEIENLIDFDPLAKAFVHKEFSEYVSGLELSKNGLINLTSYKPNELVYSSNSTSEQLAVFSEMWYGPDKGWQAYIDGEPVEHIRVNYVLRALRVPAGKHEIRFEFDPKSARMGTVISMISSILLFGLFAFYFWTRYKNKT